MLKPTIHLLVAASVGLIAAAGDARADNRITITSGGTYSGNWSSSNPEYPINTIL